MTTLEPGTYYWCTCGKSVKEPFCDGAHKESGKEPFAFEVTEARKVALCACQRTKKAPYCDGAHARVD